MPPIYIICQLNEFRRVGHVFYAVLAVGSRNLHLKLGADPQHLILIFLLRA